ncbi:hypothetical protein INT48_001935 [Thamnidium elegans]|uniref:Pkinase-domain-containing protein n=1 Tax=Thamnidium elegans TaxID=101142 RepID=A0A8H7VTP8_9FUNG|nr:hypothetical protein INT48_001935 [Thamnidium elegans]
MVNHSTSPTDIRTLLGDVIVDSWTQEKVTHWLEEKGWGHFTSTFEKYGICHERFLQITLAELVEYLPRTVTTYYERRRLLNEIRSLVPSISGKVSLNTPTNISINTNLQDYNRGIEGVITPSDNTTSVITARDSGIGYLSSPSSSGSPTSKSSSYSPKAAFNKIKNSFRPSTTTTMNLSPRHESPQIPARVSSTPDKISKFWATYTHWHTAPKKPNSSSQRIQITGDKEIWYSLNVTNMRDPVAIKQHILKRMNYEPHCDQYQYFHENGSDPDAPMDPQELMYLCSIADHSASHRILVKPIQHHYYGNYTFTLSTPELGKSPTSDPQIQSASPNFRPLSRKAARRPYSHKKTSSSVGIQLSDPPTRQYLEQRHSDDALSIIAPPVGLWAVAPKQPSLWAIAPPTTEFWGERPPAEIVFKHMEQYFDSQDLDKEVAVIEPLTRKLTHTKSIRVVAREASRKYHASNNPMLRRKSTKLWGQKVVEVKSRRGPQRLPSVSEYMRLSHTNQSTTEVQWIRGKLIGKGSFGRVYLAFNVGTGEVIAVKQVEIPQTASDLRSEHQNDMVESLYQEIMMLRDLDHENIVQYLGYGLDDTEGMINIFLEYVSGGSVASRLALHGAFDEYLTRYFTRQICSGLAYLHSKNILHRDIKAANILVEADGICKISDFGLSKKNDYDEVYDQNSRMSLRGSVYWMAPEVVKNEPYSAKVDIWSLGCTVIEMLTGQRPWLSLDQIAAIYNLGRLNTPTLPTNISDCAKDFLSKCFIIDPTKRPTATDLLDHAFLNTDKSFQFKDYVDKGKI